MKTVLPQEIQLTPGAKVLTPELTTREETVTEE